MMRDLIILGIGVHALEMAEIVERVNAASPTWNLLGYAAPAAHPIGELRNGYPVLGPPEAIFDYPDACLVPCNEWPAPLPTPEDRLISLIDPTAFVSRTAYVGRGCVLYPGCYVGLNARLGDCVFCLSGCVINHDDVIGDRVVMATGVKLAGSVTVEDECYLGQGCNVRQFLRIGRGSLAGMGAVVVKDAPPNSVVAGNPARWMRNNRA
jgi:carbonic anhydrase/acetyltransferase-like protein (isoleucine patch superfamily)